MGKEDGPIGIDIGSRAVKVAQVIGRGGEPAEVRRGWAQLPAGFVWNSTAPGPLEQALGVALGQAGVKGKRAVCVLPRHQVTLRFTEFPAAGAEEMAKMAALEAEQHIPLPAGEMVVGGEVLGGPSAESGLVPVLIAAARRGVVESHLSLLSALNLQPQQITMDAICLFRLWQSSPSGKADSAPAFLVDMGARGMVISVVERGLLRMSRAVPGGGDELTRAFQADFGLSFEAAEELKRQRGLQVLQEREGKALAGWLEGLAAEIRRSAMAFGGGAARNARLYLSGGGCLLAGLEKSLEQATGLKASLLFPGSHLLSAPEGALFALAFAASEAASKKAGTLNLVLPEMAAEEKTLRRRRAWAGAGLAGGIALLTFIGGSYLTLKQREARLAGLTGEWQEGRRVLAQARTLTEKRNDLFAQADFLGSAHGGKHAFLDLLLEIHKHAPKGVWLTSLMIEKAAPSSGDAEKSKWTHTLQMTGKAPDNGAVADLVAALSRLGGFREVNLQSARGVRFGEKQVVEFSVSCRFEARGRAAAGRASEEKEGR